MEPTVYPRVKSDSGLYPRPAEKSTAEIHYKLMPICSNHILISRCNLQEMFIVPSESIGRYVIVASGTDASNPSSWRARVEILWEDNKKSVLVGIVQFFGTPMAALAHLLETQTSRKALIILI